MSNKRHLSYLNSGVSLWVAICFLLPLGALPCLAQRQANVRTNMAQMPVRTPMTMRQTCVHDSVAAPRPTMMHHHISSPVVQNRFNSTFSNMGASSKPSSLMPCLYRLPSVQGKLANPLVRMNGQHNRAWQTNNNYRNANVNVLSSRQLVNRPAFSNRSLHLWFNTINRSGVAPTINLDLSSNSQSMVAGRLIGDRTITINVGGSVFTVGSGTKLTQSEYLAVMQVAHTGQQSLILDAQGSAVSGSVVINPRMSQLLSSLVIPQGVSVIDLTRSGTINLNGSLTNSGSLYVGSYNPNLSAITINSNSINVQSQGLISNVLPANSLLNLNQNLSLNLNSVNQIINAGSIISSGSINLVSGAGNITNTGLITSNNGSINIASAQPSTNLNINSNGGTYLAANGSINVRDGSYKSVGNLNLTGGNFYSQQLNTYSGKGTADINIGEVTGTVNTYAGSAHIQVLTPNLNLGVLDVSGDPFVSNNAGNLNLTSVTFPTSYLVATASGSIYTSLTTTNLNTSSATTNGGNVVLAAGVIATDNAGTITLTRSGTGGDIYLVTGNTFNGNISRNLLAFNTASTKSGSNGGNVTLIAVSSAAGNNTGGHILLPTSLAITSQGAGTGSNGNFNIIAEATEPAANAISMGSVERATTVFASGGGGTVNISVATPNLAGATINDADGAVTGSFNSTNYQNGRVNLALGVFTPTTATGSVFGGAITMSGGSNSGTLNLTTTAGTTGNITLSGTINAPTAVNLTAAGGSITIGGAMNTGTLTAITSPGSNGNITINGNITATTAVNVTADGSGNIITPFNVIATISAPNFPTAATINPAGTQVWIAQAGFNQMSVYNTSTNGLIATINIPTGNHSLGIVFNPSGTLAYVSNGANAVYVINTTTRQVVSTITVGNAPQSIAINPAGTRVYVVNQGDSTVSVINTGNNAVIATIPVGSSSTAAGLNVNPAGTLVYAANNLSNTVSVIDASTNTVVTTIGGFSTPEGVAVNPNGLFAYVTNMSGNSLSIVNTSTNTIVSTVAVGSTPYGVSVDPTGTFAYVANSGSANVSILNTNTNTVASTVATGANPFGIGSSNAGFIGNNLTAYIDNIAGQTATVIQMPAIVAPTITLTSGSGNINVGVGGTSTLRANTSGNATVTAHGALNLGASTIGGTFTAGATGNLSTSGAITATQAYFQSTATNGSLSVDANLTGTNGIVLSTVGPTAAILQTGGLISSPNGSVVLNTSQLGNSSSNINITSNSSLAFNIPITGNTVAIASTLNNGSITLGANVIGYNGVTLSTTGASSTIIQTGGQISIYNGALSLNTSQFGNSSNAINIFSVPSLSFNVPVVASSIYLITAGTNAGVNINQNMIANGTNGGRIDIFSAGPIVVSSGVTLEANGTSGNGGMIQFGSHGGSSLNVINNGLIEATNTANNSGIIGFNGGSEGFITLTGSGSVFAGQYVGFGDLNSSTLAVNNAVGFPASSNLSYGRVYISQGGLVSNQIFISASQIPASTSSVNFSNFGSASASLSAAQIQLYEQIGTRIATDYTPIQGPYPLQTGPLEGYVDIAETNSTVGEALFTAGAFNANELSALSTEGIVFGSGSRGEFLDLVKGYVLFMPQNNIRVQTREGLVHIPKGAIVWIMETGADVAIYDLDDNRHNGKVEVEVNAKTLTLSPGVEILLSKNTTESFEVLNPGGANIGYRNVKCTDVGKETKAYICEFSIAHGLNSVGVIRNLLFSQNTVQQKAAHSILKNAAILSDLTGSDYQVSSNPNIQTE